jgi:hypothetical protein
MRAIEGSTRDTLWIFKNFFKADIIPAFNVYDEENR